MKYVKSFRLYEESYNEETDERLYEFDLPGFWEIFGAGAAWEAGKAVGALALVLLALGGTAVAFKLAEIKDKIKELIQDRKRINGAKEGQDFLLKNPKIKEIADISKELWDAKAGKVDKRRKDWEEKLANLKAITKDLTKKRQEIAKELAADIKAAGLSKEAIQYLGTQVSYLDTSYFVRMTEDYQLDESVKHDLNTVKKFKDEFSKKVTNRYPSEETLLQFIYDNFERITGEEYESAYDFISNDHIADIISTYKYGEEVIDIWKSMFESEIFEGRGRKRIIVKRKYTTNHPAKSVGKFAPVRETVLRHVKENGGEITKDALMEFIKGMNEERGTRTTWNWVRRNSKYIKETNGVYKLTKLGKRVLKATNINESAVLNEGQFSWIAQDTRAQIGNEPTNRRPVYMFDNEGNRWEETKYEGYGEFGGQDYYELMAKMNGFTEEDMNDPYVKRAVISASASGDIREIGIALSYNPEKLSKRIKEKDIIFPALVHDKNYNWKRHDFKIAPQDDPNQGWDVSDEEDDDYGW